MVYYVLEDLLRVWIHHGLSSRHAEVLQVLVQRGPPFPESLHVGIVLTVWYRTPPALEVLGCVVWW